jgi:hypothetical protein
MKLAPRSSDLLISADRLPENMNQICVFRLYGRSFPFNFRFFRNRILRRTKRLAATSLVSEVSQRKERHIASFIRFKSILMQISIRAMKIGVI